MLPILWLTADKCEPDEHLCCVSGGFQSDGRAAEGTGASRAAEESKRSEPQAQHEHVKSLYLNSQILAWYFVRHG